MPRSLTKGEIRSFLGTTPVVATLFEQGLEHCRLTMLPKALAAMSLCSVSLFFHVDDTGS